MISVEELALMNSLGLNFCYYRHPEAHGEVGRHETPHTLKRFPEPIMGSQGVNKDIYATKKCKVGCHGVSRCAKP